MNAGNITYSLVMASLWNRSTDVDLDKATTLSQQLIAMAAIIEGVMLLSVIVKVVYFAVRLWASAGEYCIADECNSSGTRSSSNLLNDVYRSSPAVIVGTAVTVGAVCGTGDYSSVPGAYTIFAARSVQLVRLDTHACFVQEPRILHSGGIFLD